VVARRANQLAAGLTLMFFGFGLSALIGRPFVGTLIAGLPHLQLLGLELQGAGARLVSYDILVYLATPTALLTWWLLFRTRWGLGVRTVGESPAAAFAAGLRPVRLLHDVLAIPTYYADQLDLHTGATGFRVAGLGLDRPGLKVLDFHPNMVYLNAADDDHYQATRPSYHDPQALLAARNPGRGVRTLLIELLEEISAGRFQTVTAGEIDRLWRTLPGVLG